MDNNFFGGNNGFLDFGQPKRKKRKTTRVKRRAIMVPVYQTYQTVKKKSKKKRYPIRQRNTITENYGVAKKRYSQAKQIKRFVLPSAQARAESLEKKQAAREKEQEYKEKFKTLQKKEQEYNAETWRERKRKFSETKARIKGIFVKKKSIYE